MALCLQLWSSVYAAQLLITTEIGFCLQFMMGKQRHKKKKDMQTMSRWDLGCSEGLLGLGCLDRKVHESRSTSHASDGRHMALLDVKTCAGARQWLRVWL